MPFNGNCWDRSQTVSYQDILLRVEAQYPPAHIERLVDAPNDTARNYRIKGGAGTFAVISSVTNPFCSTCNRLRLTANGRMKNCLFSTSEIDFLKAYRNNEALEPLMQQAVGSKHKMRGGMDTDEKFDNPDRNQNNRSMILIGG